LIGIGLEETGYQEFLDEEYFDGEVYLDTKKEQYKALGYRKFNICNIWCVICCNADTKKVANEGRKNKVKHNWRGNGFLTGGTIIIEKGGQSVILSHKMEGFGDHLENSKILKALNIDEREANPENKYAITVQPTSPTCNDDVCTR
jgi:hypothetical protein